MLDTNIYDKVEGDIGLKEKLVSLITSGEMEILTTHIQEDELSKKSDKIAIREKKIPTDGFVIGVSKLGEARLGNGKIEQIVTKKVNTAGAIWGCF